MPPIVQALSANERAEWLTFWKQALVWTINILETDEDGKISETPSEWNRNIGRFGYHKNKLWYNMLGMNGIISNLWDER